MLFTYTNKSESELERTGKWDNKGNQTVKLGRKEEGGENVRGRGKYTRKRKIMSGCGGGQHGRKDM